MAPTRIGQYRSAQDRFFKKQGKARLTQRISQPFGHSVPFMGWVPDVPAHLVGHAGARDVQNLVQFPTKRLGTFVGSSMGFSRAQAAAVGFGSGSAIILGAQYLDPTNNTERVIATAGDAGANVMRFYRDVAGTFTQLTLNASATATSAPTRDTLMDACVYPFGAPTRPTPITESMLIMCGGGPDGPTSRVYCTPDGSASPTNQGVYDELDRTSALSPFQARSCESFDGRVYFLSTIENGTAFDNRVRWTPPATANPDPSARGAGARDFPIFDRGGQRALGMKERLVLYFGDGVAMGTPKRLLTDPVEWREISRTRGLLGPGAVTAVSPTLHFGIFNDGWWFLNINGAWKEAGVLRLEETRGKNIEWHKWRETWYDELDTENRHLISIEHEPFRDDVYITYPSRITGGMKTIIYNIPTDTAWPQPSYGPTVFFRQDRVLRDATTYADLDAAGTTYAGLDAAGTTYADLVARFGFEGLLHGTTDGLVMAHDPGLATQDGVSPAFLWETHYLSPGAIADQWTLDTVALHYLQAAKNAATVTALTGSGETASERVNLYEPNGAANQYHTGYATFRIEDSHIAYRITGTAPALIQSIRGEFYAYSAQDRDGQGSQ